MTVTAWDEPSGATPRGTLIVLSGRGETAASYQRFGRRLSADAYRVRLVPVDFDDLDAARVTVEKLLADEALPGPKVLVGTDSGATLAALLAPELPADAVVLAGLALPDSSGVASWEEEVEARTACPVHRGVISQDRDFARGGLNEPLPWPSVSLSPSDKPTLLLHGSADPITPVAAALAPYADAGTVRVRVVNGDRPVRDVVEDVVSADWRAA